MAAHEKDQWKMKSNTETVIDVDPKHAKMVIEQIVSVDVSNLQLNPFDEDTAKAINSNITSKIMLTE